jgi:hypothetical protein
MRGLHAMAHVIVAGACLIGAGCSRTQARFELLPEVVSACQQPVATQVRWDVRALGLKRVQVFIHNIGKQPKLWMDGEAIGAAKSGPWAQDGYTVILKSMNGVELSRRTLTTTPCPGAWWL